MDNLLITLNKNKKGYTFYLKSELDWHCLWVSKSKKERCIFAAHHSSMQTVLCVLINFFGL